MEKPKPVIRFGTWSPPTDLDGQAEVAPQSPGHGGEHRLPSFLCVGEFAASINNEEKKSI